MIAGTVLALTPVAVTIFRYNNPDALLVLLMIAAVWALLRAVDDGRLRWLLLCGRCLGLGYLTKQLEVALVMPALAITYLVAGPRSLLGRAGQLVLGLGAAVVAAGWWVLLVQLWPAGKRPWIGGTQTNSILELTLALQRHRPAQRRRAGQHRFAGLQSRRSTWAAGRRCIRGVSPASAGCSNRSRSATSAGCCPPR